MSDAPTRYRRHPDVVTRNILGETLLVPVSHAVADMENIFALNETGAFVWERLDGDTPLHDIEAALGDAFEVAPRAAARDLAALIDALSESGLIEAVNQ